jgi:hypothetical protein
MRIPPGSIDRPGAVLVGELTAKTLDISRPVSHVAGVAGLGFSPAAMSLRAYMAEAGPVGGAPAQTTPTVCGPRSGGVAGSRGPVALEAAQHKQDRPACPSRGAVHYGRRA